MDLQASFTPGLPGYPLSLPETPPAIPAFPPAIPSLGDLSTAGGARKAH